MPYKVYKTGNRYCVHKKNENGSKGKRMGCHGSEEKARAQQKALYASEDSMSKAKRIKEKKRREKRELEIQKQKELDELENEEQALRRQTGPDIKRQFEKTVDGWKHPPNWSQKFTNQANYISVAVWASGANRNQYGLVNYGSPPHSISP